MKLPITMSGRRGFSIIELLVVVAIIMIIASISAPLGTIVFYREKEITLRENLKAIRKAIDDFHAYSKGSSRTLEREMTDSVFVPEEVVTGTEKYMNGTAYTASEYWDWKHYPSSWSELYNSGFLRRDSAINPFSNIAEDFNIVVAIPLEYLQEKRLVREEGWLPGDKPFKLPNYPDGNEQVAQVNFNMKDFLPGRLAVDVRYDLEPTLVDDSGIPYVKYVFSREEWYDLFCDASTGLPRTFDASYGVQPQLYGMPISFPFKARSITNVEIPMHNARIFDVRYPSHDISLDGNTYYDQW